MKTILISSAISIAIGFTFGWLIRSATAELDGIENKIVVIEKDRKRPTTGNGDPLAIPPERMAPSDIDRAISPQRDLPVGDAKPPESAEKAEQAKWNRLIEVLGLNADQAKTLESAIRESEPSLSEGEELGAAYADAGEKLQQSILSMLSEDQAKAFKELQERSLNNQLHSKAMEQYVQELGKLDLTAEQTDQALGVLRKHAEEEAASIPSGARLLLDGSVLPIGQRRITEDGYRLLGKLAASGAGGPMGIEEIAAIHREEMERRMGQFEGILTPAQLQRYQAGILESAENLNQFAPRN
ncbi:hypothetical protein HZ994_17670 [Akkermansiaceae bacterium]|nr:hypothetical protein HZ994_17670 [Akkermansiaceae bacterium]